LIWLKAELDTLTEILGSEEAGREAFNGMFQGDPGQRPPYPPGLLVNGFYGHHARGRRIKVSEAKAGDHVYINNPTERARGTAYERENGILMQDYPPGGENLDGVRMFGMADEDKIRTIGRWRSGYGDHPGIKLHQSAWQIDPGLVAEAIAR
jgi:hypothetical protein